MNRMLADEAISKAVEKGEVMPPHTLYNRVSIENDIPISVAEAMARSAGICSALMSTMDEKEQRYAVGVTYVQMWVSLASPLNLPEERMRRAVNATLEGVVEMNKQLEALALKVQNQAEKKACA